MWPGQGGVWWKGRGLGAGGLDSSLGSATNSATHCLCGPHKPHYFSEPYLLSGGVGVSVAQSCLLNMVIQNRARKYV